MRKTKYRQHSNSDLIPSPKRHKERSIGMWRLLLPKEVSNMALFSPCEISQDWVTVWLMHPLDLCLKNLRMWIWNYLKGRVESWLSDQWMEVKLGSVTTPVIPFIKEHYINTVLCSLNKEYALLPVFVWVRYYSWADWISWAPTPAH